MKRLTLVVVALFVFEVAYADEKSHWAYSGAEGPEHWGALSPDFAVCSAGKSQSPVDLRNAVRSDLQPIEFHYHAGGNEIVNNGHTVQVNYAPGSKLSIDGRDFELKQYHFHAPSENLINGKSYPMEAHLVHADKDGNLVVVAVMFVEGAQNASLADAWAHLPEKVGEKVSLSNVAVEGLLPSKRDYYRYDGSLTTPPCSEGVRWLVLKEPVTASRAQMEAFAHVMHHSNSRPVQALNARLVLQ